MGDDWPGIPEYLDLDNGTTAHDFADVITSVGEHATVIASFKDDPWTGMDGRPAIVGNAYGEGRTVYVGARLGRDGIARSLPMIFSSLGVEVPEASDPGLLRVERVDEASGARFVFLFNRTHAVIEAMQDGRPVIASLADVGDGKVTVRPNGVIVLRK